jgi:hypothetical protein
MLFCLKFDENGRVYYSPYRKFFWRCVMASKRNKRRRSCESKVRYEKREEAVVTRRFLNAKSFDHYEEYPCHFCSGWHVGRMSKKKQAVRKAARGF